MKQPVPCVHCGQPIRATAKAGHPYMHVTTGKTACTPTTRAEPAEEHRWQVVSSYADLALRLTCTHCGKTKTEQPQ